MERKTFQVPNIGCEGCVKAIKGELSEIAGVQSVDGAVDTRTVTVTYDNLATWEQIVSTLREIDYAPEEA
jgi:copper chaperone CopZ